MTPVDADRNLRFGAFALQFGLVDAHQFASACEEWAALANGTLADVFTQRGWIGSEDRLRIESRLNQGAGPTVGPSQATLPVPIDAATRPKALDTLPMAGSHVIVDAISPSPGETRSRYTLTRVHAEGGLGKVWLARDVSLNREVALKEIRVPQAGHPEMVRRFLKEAQITGQLEHPAIVPVYELGRRPEDDQPFYTMRFVQGRTLKAEIAEYHQRRLGGENVELERARLLRAFVTICQAIGYAHSRGVIHRDLKPENVVLGSFGEVVVLDWGLAKLVDRPDDPSEPAAGVDVSDEAATGATRAGSQLGTPAYMAPEQADGRLDLIGPATDIYGLGAILFEILTGRAPHDGATTVEVMNRIVGEETPRARSIEPTVPAALEAVCARAMAKEREHRYETAAALAEDVERWLADGPVSAYPESFTQRAGRWLRRHRTMAQAGVGSLALVAVISIAAAVAIDAARGRATQALDAERLAKAEAEANFQTARQAVKDYLTTISESTLLQQQDRADLRALRKELLQGALKYYQGFIVQHADDPKLQEELADAYSRVALITEEISLKDEALKSYQKALAIRETLARTSDDAKIRRDLVASLNNIGNLLRTSSRPVEALRSYERAIEISQKLVDAHPDNDADRIDLASTIDNLGSLLRQTNHPAESRQSYERALAIRRSLLDARPDDPRRMGDLAQSYNNTGNLLHEMGRSPESLRAYEQAKAIRERLAKAKPGDLNHQSELARLHYNMGVVRLGIGHRAEALKSFEESLAILQKLADANPSVIQFQTDLATTLNNLGVTLRAAGRLDDALRAQERARQIRQRLADADPSNLTYQTQLASSDNNIAVLQIMSGSLSNALPTFERALAIRQKVSDATPDDLELRRDLAASYLNVGILQRGTSRLTDALRSLERALAIRQQLAAAKPNDSSIRGEVASSFDALGKLKRETSPPSEALRAFERAIALWDGLDHPTATLLYNKACSLAQASGLAKDDRQRSDYGDRAVRTLRQSIEAGLRDRAQLSYDSDLASLRSRPDFRLLMMDLAFPADPFSGPR